MPQPGATGTSYPSSISNTTSLTSGASAVRSSRTIILVTTADPTALIDAYTIIKILLRRSPKKPISIVVNNTTSVGEAEHVFCQLSTAAMRFFQGRIEYLGTIPQDPELGRAVRERTPVIEYAADAPSSRAIRSIARRLTVGLEVE